MLSVACFFKLDFFTIWLLDTFHLDLDILLLVFLQREAGDGAHSPSSTTVRLENVTGNMAI